MNNIKGGTDEKRWKIARSKWMRTQKAWRNEKQNTVEVVRMER